MRSNGSVANLSQAILVPASRHAGLGPSMQSECVMQIPSCPANSVSGKHLLSIPQLIASLEVQIACVIEHHLQSQLEIPTHVTLPSVPHAAPSRAEGPSTRSGVWARLDTSACRCARGALLSRFMRDLATHIGEASMDDDDAPAQSLSDGLATIPDAARVQLRCHDRPGVEEPSSKRTRFGAAIHARGVGEALSLHLMPEPSTSFILQCLIPTELCRLGCMNKSYYGVVRRSEVWHKHLAALSHSLGKLADRAFAKSLLQLASRAEKSPRLADYALLADATQDGQTVFSGVFDLRIQSGWPLRAGNQLIGSQHDLRLVSSIYERRGRSGYQWLIQGDVQLRFRLVDRQGRVYVHLCSGGKDAILGG